jgi:hypothetical protein
MSVGKYSPTVSYAYSVDKDWWEKNGGGTVDVNFDKDGYDSYGYDQFDRDRAGNYEDEYLFDGEWIDGELVYKLYQDTYAEWAVRLPQGKKFEDK